MELLVAATLTAALAGGIIVIVHNVSTTWSRSSGRLGADAQARLILDQLTLDLQGAQFRDDGNVWLAADVVDNITTSGNLWTEPTGSGKPKPTGTGINGSIELTRPSIADPLTRFGKAGVWLRFFTSSRGSNTATNPATISAPVAVGYQIIRRFTATNQLNLNTAYLLHRAESRPGADAAGRPGALESGYDITAVAYTTSNAANNSGATTGDPRGIKTPGTNAGAARNLDAVLADNVIDFGLRCYVRDAASPGGLRLIFPATPAGALTNAPQPLRSQLPANTPATAPNYRSFFLFPDVVDVMVRVLTDDGAALIANIEKNQTPPLTVPLKYSSNAQQWWWGVAQENSRVYTRRIVLRAQPL